MYVAIFWNRIIKILASIVIIAVIFLFFQNHALSATSYIGASNLIVTNGGAPGAITPNASTANGDLLVFYHYSRATGGNETVTLPAGFTSVFNSVTANQGLVAVGWRIRQAGDTTYTATVTNHTASGSGETILEWIETFRGTDTVSPIIDYTASLSTWTSSLNIGPISAPGTATVRDGDMVVVFGGRFENTTAQTVLTGNSLTWTTRTRNDTTQGSDASAVAQTGLNASGINQTVTAKTITTTGTAQAGAGRMFIIRKTPPAGSVSASPTTCTILSGGSTCTVPFTWIITNTTSPNLYNSTTANQYSTSASGSGVSYAITNGANTVQARDSSTVLASTSVTASCTSGTTWNGSICALNTFTIVATSGTNGTVLPSGSTVVTEGGSQIYTITPDSGYGVATLLIDDNSVATSTSYTFTNVQASHTIYATFSLLTIPPVTHTITSSAGSNGTINPLGATVVSDGTNQTFNIIPDGGFTITTLIVDGGGVSTSTSYTFTNVTTDHTISATFALIPPPPGSFTIIANQNPNGGVMPSGSTVVIEGASQTYIITPDVGYDVLNLIIDSFPVATSTSHTFTDVQADHTIEATFIALPGAEPIVATTRRLASITFSGKAFPGGKISIVQKELETEKIASQEYFTNGDGCFSIRFIDLPEGAHSFGLLVKDIEGRTSQTKFFLVDVSRGDEIFKDIVTPPTIDVLYGQVSRGTNAKIYGYASPGHTIRIYLNDILNNEVLAGRGGVYSFELPTGALNFGQYGVKTKQINLDGGKESDFSTSRTFIVSNLAVVKADMSGDGKVDIKDWSIFLARWGVKDSLGRIALDLSGDGKVDIADFSIFIKTIRKK